MMTKIVFVALLATSVISSPIKVSSPGSDDHDRLRAGGLIARSLDNTNAGMENEVDTSISNIAAKLLEESPISPDDSNQENQAKVVNHIKGLLSDIVTNTIIEDDGENENSNTDEIKVKSNNYSKNTPTILQTVLNLDPNIIKDKESFIQVIKEMKLQEKESYNDPTTPYVSVFETDKVTENPEKFKLVKDQNILDQYLEVYDDHEEEDIIEATTLVLKTASEIISRTSTSSTTTTTTTTTTTSSPTTKSTTSSTTSTTEATTTTTTKEPTILERAGSIVTGGIGGIFNGFATLGQALSQATSPFWIPINVGRRRRSIEDIADVVQSQITNKEIFMNFLLFQKRIQAMNPEQLNKIVKEVVKKVINNGRSDDLDQYENLYDDLISRQITDLLLKPRPYKRTTKGTTTVMPADTEVRLENKVNQHRDLKSSKSDQNTLTTTLTPQTKSTSTPTTTTTSTTSTTPPTTTTTKRNSLILSLLEDQGPQALGITVASLAYTSLAAMPYWLPLVAGK